MLDCTRASVWARLPSAAGQRGWRMLPARLIVALARVDHDPPAVLGKARAHVEWTPAHAVAVHRVFGRVGAVGDARLQRLADGVPALALEEGPSVLHGVGAEAVEQLEHPALAEPAP